MKLWSYQTTPKVTFYWACDVTFLSAYSVFHNLIRPLAPPFSLPQLIEIVGRINVASSTCVHEFSRFFWRFCRTFGKIFTSTKVGVLRRSTATSSARRDVS